MTTEQLAALREELRTQDNACTAHPLYCVYDHHLTGRRKSTAPKDNWRFITACLTKNQREDRNRSCQAGTGHTGEEMTCRSRRGAVEVIDGKA
jgi:hypothetical protein